MALRYLRSKRTLNVVNLVSRVGFAGVLCGTAALIIVLSVFNGFETLASSIYGVFDPELKISPVEGKTFVVDSALLGRISALDEVARASPVLDENVLLKYKDRQTIALMRGIDAGYEADTPLASSIYSGEFAMHAGAYPAMVAGYGISARLGLFAMPAERPAVVYVPRRDAGLSVANPASALTAMTLPVAGIFEIEKSFDDTYVFAPLEFVRELLDRSAHASSIELRLREGADLDAARAAVARIAGSEMTVKTRRQQNETLYRMMRSEKIMVYAILMLIVVILSFNISGSLSMLMTEKRDDLATLRSMGATDRLLRRIFLSAGAFITLVGIVIGLTVGLTVCLIQQRFGLLRLPGNNMLVDAYPVKILFADILLVGASVFLIGYLATYIVVVRKIR
jgi:ABC-type lipoprotein release transport system permease subunit